MQRLYAPHLNELLTAAISRKQAFRISARGSRAADAPSGAPPKLPLSGTAKHAPVARASHLVRISLGFRLTGEGQAVKQAEALSDEVRRIRPVFVSYASADRKRALSICRAIEKRGTACWISTRDVAPGENYQEAIVRSIRNAPAVVLLFSQAANVSDEIKKELSLASRYGVPVIALRIENVEPSDAFAYELSTRQWIDAFEDWDRSIDSLVSRVGQLSGAEPVATIATAPDRSSFTSRRPIWIWATAGLLLLA